MTAKNKPYQDHVPLPDAVSNNWVDSYAPTTWRPWLKLMRVDRPIGCYLLYIPCLWAIGIGAMLERPFLDLFSMAILCLVGAFLTRSLGCVANDLADRNIDTKVARTKNRPLASGALGVGQAIALLLLLGALSLCLLTFLNQQAVIIALASIPLILTYPWLKRVTSWPQVMLGLCMNWGFLVAWFGLELPEITAMILIFGGAVCWTIGYDTIYALQDREDDRLIGVHSTALLAGDKPVMFIGLFYVAMVIMMVGGWWQLIGSASLIWLSPMMIHLLWQLARINPHEPRTNLMLFKSNRQLALLVMLPTFHGLFYQIT